MNEATAPAMQGEQEEANLPEHSEDLLSGAKPPESLGALLSRHAASQPDVAAIRFGARTTSFATLDERADAVAAALIKGGAVAGDRIVYVGKNHDAAFELLFGAARMGAVLTPLIWRLAPREIAAIILDCEARLVFLDADQLDRLEDFRALLPPGTEFVAIGGAATGLLGYEEWLSAGEEGAIPLPAIDPHSTALQLYTSGTTGKPKGVMLSHAALLSLSPPPFAAGFEWSQWPAGEVSLVAFPMGHVAGIGFGLLSLANRATIVIHPEFSAGDVLRSIGEDRLTRIFLVPAAIQALLAQPGVEQYDYSSLSIIFYGASPITPRLLQDATRVFGCGFCQQYGATELCGTVCALPPQDHDPRGNKRMHGAGIGMPGVKVRIRDPQSGEVLGTGALGEIEILSPSVTSGYWKQPEQTRAAFTEDGWYRTGDAGTTDEDGYLYLLDRFKDVICSGGENVYPTEVENALSHHAGVADVAVIGVPDPRWGEAVKAIVVRRAGATVAAEELIAFARESIAGFKVPKSVDFRETLPRNASGKVLRRELREPFWEGQDRSIG